MVGSRRGFLRGVLGAWASVTLYLTGGDDARAYEAEVPEIEVPDVPEETVQDLIDQIRILEDDRGRRDHIRSLEDRIRVRLFLNGMACIYHDGHAVRSCRMLCVLHVETGELMTLTLESPKSQFLTLRDRQELKKVKFESLDLRKVPYAWQI